MKDLLESINKSMFANIDFDEVLDSRDISDFDTEWVRVDSDIEKMKQEKGYTEEQKLRNHDIREQVYLKVYELCQDGELAGYISDDFGLIADSEYFCYKDEWLNKMISCYKQSTIPCGKL